MQETKLKETIEEVKNKIFQQEIPNWSRKGQFVFNRCKEIYGELARIVQFEDKIDCFYSDIYIDDFIEAVAKRLMRRE